MIKQALLSSAALVLASTVAFAGTAHAPKGMIVTKSLHGKPIMGMISNHKAIRVVHGQHQPLPAGFGNLSDMPNAPFISWYSYYVYGANANSGYPFQIATPFTAPAKQRVTGVDVGLAAYYAGLYGYTGNVSIYDDAGGVPGEQMGKAGKITAAETTWGPCCNLTHAAVKKVKIKSGKQYWVVVQADDDSFMVWGLQDSDFVNPITVAFNFSGSGWTAETTNVGYGGGPNFWVE
jgi:hypothetical protein